MTDKEHAMRIASLGYVIAGGNVLLGEKKRGSEIGSGTLNGAGGKLEGEDGDSIDRCLIRETEQEFGITPTNFEKHAVIRFLAAGIPDFEVHAYLITAWEGTPRETAEMFQPAWYPISGIPYDRMLEADSMWLPKLFNGEKFNADVYYRQRAKDFDRITFAAFAG